MAEKKKKHRLLLGPQNVQTDLPIANPIDSAVGTKSAVVHDRLTFDGYKLRWHGALADEYNAFSGQPDLSARESKKDLGPTPQGLFAVDPKKIEELEPSDDWGGYRVRLEPYLSTVNRMSKCFDAIRTDMYIHGGKVNGTHGCIEINDDNEENRFFAKLKKYARKIELEVKFVGNLEKMLEEPKCPY